MFLFIPHNYMDYARKYLNITQNSKLVIHAAVGTRDLLVRLAARRKMILCDVNKAAASVVVPMWLLMMSRFANQGHNFLSFASFRWRSLSEIKLLT